MNINIIKNYFDILNSYFEEIRIYDYTIFNEEFEYTNEVLDTGDWIENEDSNFILYQIYTDKI